MDVMTTPAVRAVDEDTCTLVNGSCWGCHYADFCPTWLDTGLERVLLPIVRQGGKAVVVGEPKVG